MCVNFYIKKILKIILKGLKVSTAEINMLGTLIRSMSFSAQSHSVPMWFLRLRTKQSRKVNENGYEN